MTPIRGVFPFVSALTPYTNSKYISHVPQLFWLRFADQLLLKRAGHHRSHLSKSILAKILSKKGLLEDPVIRRKTLYYQYLLRHTAPTIPRPPISSPNPGVEAGVVWVWIEPAFVCTVCTGPEDVGTDVSAVCVDDGSAGVSAITFSTMANGEKAGVSAEYFTELPSPDKDTRDVASSDQTPF